MAWNIVKMEQGNNGDSGLKPFEKGPYPLFAQYSSFPTFQHSNKVSLKTLELIYTIV
jgi:hypothetical protein